MGQDAVVCGKPGDHFTTDHQVATLVGCELYEGSFFFILVSDLSPLESLRIIRGSLTIPEDTALESLAGLEKLEWVGAVRFSESRFEELSGLSGLTGTDDYFELIALGSVTSLHGLEKLRTVGGGFRIEAIPALTTLHGLGGLETVGGDLDIWYNENLTSLAGLSALQKVGGNVTIHQNAKLTAAEIDAFVARVEIAGVVNRD